MPEFRIDETELTPKFSRPGLLTHPHVPRGLAGVNPRTLFGQAWWDVQRRAAYRTNNYCCHACGIHTANDPFEQHIEGHEVYGYRYRRKIAYYRGVVALCHSCHMFIHSGRLWAMYKQFQISKQQVEYIIRSRLQLLHDKHLKPFYYTLMVEAMLDGLSETRAFIKVVKKERHRPPPKGSAGNRWCLVVEGRKYYGSH